MKLTQGANQFRIVGFFEDGTNIQGMLGWGEDEEGKTQTLPLEGRRGSSTQVSGEPKAFFARSHGITMRSIPYWSLLSGEVTHRDCDVCEG